ncbi:MAG: hypothetical protein JWQ62_1922 [Lacunisphaera sp.]|nr:hypothetical protein [Lacunisphaera sp.]
MATKNTKLLAANEGRKAPMGARGTVGCRTNPFVLFVANSIR